MLRDVIVFVLLAWVVPLVLFVFYQVTTPVSGARWRRRLVPFRQVRPVTWILIAQKVALILVVGFIGVVRFFGGFPAQDWVAFGLYALLVLLAWTVFAYLRHLQLPRERETRDE